MLNLIILYAGVALMGLLISITPSLLRLRIKLLRKLRLNRIADWHERHFSGVVIAIRIIMGTVAVVLLGAAVTGG